MLTEYQHTDKQCVHIYGTTQRIKRYKAIPSCIKYESVSISILPMTFLHMESSFKSNKAINAIEQIIQFEKNRDSYYITTAKVSVTVQRNRLSFLLRQLLKQCFSNYFKCKTQMRCLKNYNASFVLACVH